MADPDYGNSLTGCRNVQGDAESPGLSNPPERSGDVTTSETWAGWIRLGGILLLIIAFIDFFQGLIAVIRSEYYVRAPGQIIIVDTSTWGWIMMIWGVVLGATGWGLTIGATWARWAAITVCSINFLIQLGFAGSTQYTLWALTGLALNLIVLYALVVRWDESAETIRRMNESRM